MACLTNRVPNMSVDEHTPSRAVNRLRGRTALVTGRRKGNRPRHRAAYERGGCLGRLCGSGWRCRRCRVGRACGARHRLESGREQRIRCRGGDCRRRQRARSASCVGELRGNRRARRRPPDRRPVDEWRRTLEVNLTGAFLMSKHALPLLIAARGNIVNVASALALVAKTDEAAYIASKGGLLMLSKSMALDYAASVRVRTACVPAR